MNRYFVALHSQTATCIKHVPNTRSTRSPRPMNEQGLWPMTIGHRPQVALTSCWSCDQMKYICIIFSIKKLNVYVTFCIVFRYSYYNPVKLTIYAMANFRAQKQLFQSTITIHVVSYWNISVIFVKVRNISLVTLIFLFLLQMCYRNSLGRNTVVSWSR